SDNGGHWPASVVTDYREVILIGLHLGITASIDFQIIAKHAKGYRHDLFRVRERHQGLVEIRHKSGSGFHGLAFGRVGCRSDDLPNTAIFVTGQNTVSAVKPAPSAFAEPRPILEIGSVAILQLCESFEVRPERLEVIRVKYGVDKSRVLHV